MTEKKILIIGTIVVSGLAFRTYLIVRSREQQKRIQFKLNAVEEIKNIARAAQKLEERIDRGEYRNKSVSDLMNDFDFEIIAAHYE